LDQYQGEGKMMSEEEEILDWEKMGKSSWTAP
jgi:hypothetical protein